MNTICSIGIIGCGLMGTGIAEACARASLDVRIIARREASAVAGKERLLRSLDHSLRKARITQLERDEIVNRVAFTADLAAITDCQLIFEAVSEHEPTKLNVFAAIDKIAANTGVVMASNTSSIPIIRLAKATSRADQVVGTHFFNPPQTLPLVELIGSELTASSTLEQVEAFLSGTLGKQVIKAPDRAGFVVNALLIPYLLSAIKMVESGFASAEVIDTGMVLGCSHPLGPLRLADLIGLDTLMAVASALHQELNDPQYAPPPLLLRMVEADLLGKKNGRGFHSYA
jgi:3-hydroxybutyryl-CoA dehydrogenase